MSGRSQVLPDHPSAMRTPQLNTGLLAGVGQRLRTAKASFPLVAPSRRPARRLPAACALDTSAACNGDQKLTLSSIAQGATLIADDQSERVVWIFLKLGRSPRNMGG